MANNNLTHLKHDLAYANLLLKRGDFAEARALAAQLAFAGVPVQDTDRLLNDIRRRQYETKQSAERNRDIRYRLGLRSAAARIGWFIIAFAGAAYALWIGNIAVGLGMSRGFATIITTQFHTRFGVFPWTRPIYMDLVNSSILLVVTVIWIAIIVWAARDAALWEEADTPNPASYGV